MKYNVTLIDPSSYKYAYLLTDACRLIAYGLRSLGYSCDLSVNRVDGAATNVIIGSHLLGSSEVAAIVNSGAAYIAHQSEILFPGHGQYRVISAFQGEQFEPRCRSFFEHAKLIWEPYAPNRKLLELFDIPATMFRDFRVGFHEKLMDVEHRPWAEKDIDVLFLGSVSPYRAEVLNQLSRSMNVVAVLDAPAAFRNDLIARAKININLHASAESKHISLSRVTYLLNNRCVILSEQADSHPDLQALICQAPREGIEAKCHELLSNGELAAIADLSFEGYRKTSMADLLREII